MVHNILIAGTGPVAKQYAVLFARHSTCTISMVGRGYSSQKAQQFITAYQQYGFVEAHVQNQQHDALAGRCYLEQLYVDYAAVTGRYNTLILACTADSYIQVLQQLSQSILQQLEHVVLVSPTLGSHAIVTAYLHTVNSSVEVMTCSTYFGDTRVTTASHQVLTTGVKKQIYIGSVRTNSDFVAQFTYVLQRANIAVQLAESPLHAESRNSSLYVHPPLFMNDFALDVIFKGSNVPKYVYKLFPEGPITMAVINEMRQLWCEINTIMERLKVPKLNLLHFMVTENYPLRTETIDSYAIENFEVLPEIYQEYLLYVRYTAILIDPFSQPNKHGEYYDFSAVPFQSVYQDTEQIYQIPRMPAEDYYRTKLIQGFGVMLQIATPMIDTLLQRYEQRLLTFSKQPQQQYSECFTVQTFRQDIQLLQQFFASTRHDDVDIN